MTPIFDPDKPKEHHMKITPKTEDEIRRGLLLPEGEYDFEIISAEEKTSKAGNPMIALKLKVFNGGGERHISDWVMEKGEFKLRHFMFAIGFGAAYESGDIIPEQFAGQCGKLSLTVKEQEGFQPQNSVRDYIVPEEKKAEASAAKKTQAAAANAPVAGDDSIPF